MTPQFARLRTVLDVVGTSAMIVASTVLIWAILDARSQQNSPRPERSGASPKPLPSFPVSMEGAPFVGSHTARVAVLEFSDYQCPFCVGFQQTTFQLISQSYIETGKIRFALRHLPIERLHPLAFPAAEAAECGSRQGHFWRMHSELFKTPMALDRGAIISKAGAVGLDPKRLAECLDQGVARYRVQEDIALAKALSVTGTPTFLIGLLNAQGALEVKRRESGSIPAPVFARILDDMLTEAERKSR